MKSLQTTVRNTILGLCVYYLIALVAAPLAYAQSQSGNGGAMPSTGDTNLPVKRNIRPKTNKVEPQKPAKSAASRVMDSVSLLSQELEVKQMELQNEEATGRSSKEDSFREQWSYLQSQLYWLKQRSFPNDSIDWRAYLSAYLAKLRLPPLTLHLPPGVKPAVIKWENIGPRNLPVPYRQYYGVGSTSGRVNAVTFDPSNPQNLFLASAGGGIWKSTDAGKNWEPISDNWENTKISSVAIAPDGQTIYVGTGDFDGGRSAYGFGLMKSTDGGGTWTRMLKAELKGYSVHKIMIDPDDPSVVLVAAGNNPFYSFGKLYRTTNAGASWAEVVLAPADWTDAACGAKSQGGERMCFVVGNAAGGEIWRTTDHGAHWNKVTVPLTSGLQYVAVAMSPTTPRSVYLLSGTDGRIEKSLDGGANWVDITGTFPGGYNFSQGNYDRVIACSTVRSTGSDAIYVGLIDLVASFDGGTTWKSLGHTYGMDALTHNDQHAIAVNPKDPNDILVGNDGGIYRVSIDEKTNDATFDTTLNKTLTITQFYRAAFHPTDPNIMLGGAQDNASPLLMGDRNNWKNVGGGDGGFAAINRDNPATQYASDEALDALVQTKNNWATAVNITGPWSGEVRTFIAPIALDPNNQNLLYAGTNYLWRRDDTKEDDPWNSDAPHLGNQMLAVNDKTDALTYIAVAPSDSKRIYTASQEGALWMSRDKGEHWKEVDGGLPKYWITSIAVNPSAPNSILVGLSGTASKGDLPHPGHLWLCDDTTAIPIRWKLVTGGALKALPNIPVNAVVEDPANPRSSFYVGTDVGFFVSTDGGATWQNASTNLNLPNVQINDLAYIPGTGYLMAATFGRGLWRIKMPITLPQSRVESRGSVSAVRH